MHALLLVIGSGCGLFAPLESEGDDTEFYSEKQSVVLAAAEDLLARKGYVFEETELDYGMLVGSQVERVRQRRTRDAFPRDTLVRTQVVLEVSPRGAGTDLRATFSIEVERPTGERRSWPPETSPAKRLRRSFYSELRQELDGSLASSL